MSKELVISSNRHETKVAVLEDDQLVEIYFQRANEYSLAGSIHKGRVTRVLPGMQSAFVDLGLDRDTFLYVSDFFEENGDEYDRIESKPTPPPRQQSAPPPPRQEPVVISEPEEEAEALSEEAVSVVETAKPEDSAAPAAGGPEQRNGDRRGRRGRRRRTRGRGFPESKYATDLATEPGGSEPSESSVAIEEDEEPAEVILLPGESLAKYSNRVSGEAEPVDQQPDDPDSPVASELTDDALSVERFEAERFEAGILDLVDQHEAAEQEAKLAPVAEPDPEPESEPEPKSETSPAPEVVSGSAFPENAFITPMTTLDSILESEPESTSAAAIDIKEIREEIELEAEEFENEVEPVVEEPPPADGQEEAPVEEPSTEQPLQASVRDQNNRYPHRQSRRMRRRGRGGDRGDRGPNQQAETRPVQQPVAAEPVVEDRRSSPLPSITELLKEGQEIIVQIAKEPLGQKGARITSHIALPGRYVVYMPTLEHLGVSRKIASDEERQRLKKILQGHRQGLSGGFIVRTAGEGRTDEEIGADMSYLYNLWLDIRAKAEKKRAPVLLHHDLEIVQRILRDQLSDMYKTIWCDNEDVYESTVHFMQRFQPALVGRVKMYTRSAPIFDAFGVTSEIEKALRPKVWLKSGGYIVINQTEALVAIDVNTGKYVGKSNRLEDTITKTNTEAVKEIVRQIRLRDLGGIIVVDFIDMDERKNRQKVMQALEEAMRADRAPYKILQFNDFGLVAITRKRVKQSLERSLCTPCPTCEGAAYVKSVNTVVGEILQEALKMRELIDGKNVILRTHPDVAKFLKSNSNDFLEELESIVKRPVLVKSDALLHPEKFDLAW